MILNMPHAAALSSSTQKNIQSRVELWNGSTLEQVCSCHDVLSEFSVEKTGKGKFFGFGICQKLQVKLIDINRTLNITTANTAKVAFIVGAGTTSPSYAYPFPEFHIVEQPKRDETTNEISITAYDVLYKAANYTVSDLGLQAPTEGAQPYTLADYVEACARLLGVTANLPTEAQDIFILEYPAGANFEGTENIRSVLDAIAEVTQTIYFINRYGQLQFIRLGTSLNQTITRQRYIELSNNGTAVLSKIAHVTELGDNIAPEATVDGVTQYIRDNPFWELREDIATLVENAQAVVGGTSIGQFECLWNGNYLLEVGDKIQLELEDGTYLTSYVLDDTITFDGTLLQTLRWAYEENDAETPANPSSLGEALNQTFAKVDKVNKEISLVTSQTANNTANISSLILTTDNIQATVKSVETSTQSELDSIKGEIETLSKEVSLAITDEDVQIAIEKELSNGVDKVTTTTGFTFDESGLLIDKTDSEMKTRITEDGMTVYKNSEEMLKADNKGVKAVNLHATTYLIIGENSRFETYNNDRTACFWIGN